ncbi:alpha/beta hydrolase [Proteinivorax hydrogeniformans]|uniref:Alpha/beta hydrolase n=1 Tax=Proteinivorax hydrogeniformans TaxID=1826727 RepID=A0AAU8HTK0_9FIRM
MKTVLTVDLPNGETIGYRKHGVGKNTLVLVHGNMTSSKHWDVLMESLSEDDYTIYAIDLRGFGKSSYNTPIDSLGDFSDDLKMFVDKLDLKNFVLAGWSTGGGVAMHFSAQHQSYVQKLILLESVGVKGFTLYKKSIFGKNKLDARVTTKEELASQVKPIQKAQQKGRKWFMKFIWNSTIYVNNKPSKERYEEYLEDMMTQRNILDVNWALLTFNITDESNGLTQGNGLVNKINIPTLVIQGTDDKVVKPGISQETAAAIGDNAKLIMLDNCGHSPLIDRLDKLVGLFDDFVLE